MPPPSPKARILWLLTRPPPSRTLSSHALDALKEFYADRDARAKQFEQLKAEAEDKHAAAHGDGGSGAAASAGSSSSKLIKYPLSMDAFTEDWNESQFWVGLFSLPFGGGGGDVVESVLIQVANNHPSPKDDDEMRSIEMRENKMIMIK